MVEDISLLRLNSREYCKDILGLILIGFGTNAFLNWFLSSFFPCFLATIGIVIPQNYDYFPLSVNSIKILLWLTSYLFFRKYLLLQVRPFLQKLSRGKYFISEFNLDKSKLETDWEFQGNVGGDGGLQITNTPAGCLIKNNYWDAKVWDDLSATFKIDLTKVVGTEDAWFPNKKGKMKGRKFQLGNKELDFRKILGVIFKAQDFDNYLMIGVWKIEGRLIFRPHVKIAGNLDIPYLNPPSNTFPLKTQERIFEFKMLVQKRKVNLYLKRGREWRPCFHWITPTHYKTNLNEGKKEDVASEFITRKISFINLPGRFGFRNYGNEFAVVKSLEISSKFDKKDLELLVKN